MKFQRLTVLLPCHSLEDLSLKRDGYQADGLLAAWSILWHPALIAAAQATPGWVAASSPPEDIDGSLIVIPSAADSELSYEWRERAELGEGCLVAQADRDAMLETALAQLDECPDVDPDLAADFQALGLCYFYVELLTRQLRYMSNLDESTLQSRALAAANAAVQGDLDTARSELQSAFDLLNEAREYFYPVEAHLVDLTLVAPSTIGEELRAELAWPIPTNLLLSGQTLEQLAVQEPQTLAALREAVTAGRTTIVGGAWSESMLPLLSPEAIADDLRRGLDAYQRHLGMRPTIFGRRRFGLTPALPQILQRMGFTGCLHFTLDDGRFPSGNQSRVAWTGFDETAVEALARIPLDASSAETFLRVPERLGEAMDVDHSPTMILAHWPGQAASWLDDLARIASHTAALGHFVNLGEHMAGASAGQAVRHPVDEYRSPYLRQAVAADRVDPLSRHVRHEQRRATLAAWRAAATMLAAAGGNPQSLPSAELLQQVDDCLEAADLAAAESGLDQRLADGLQESTRRLAEQLAGRQPGSSPTRTMEINPCLSTRRGVPGMGYACGGSAPEPAAPSPLSRFAFWQRRRKPPRPLAEANVLRNEFLEVTLSPQTGAIQSVLDFPPQGNRLGQQLAVRTAEYQSSNEMWHEEMYASTNTNYTYTIMAADEMQVVSAGPDCGEIRCRGRMVDRENRLLAGFVQTTRLRRGSRLLELDIELDRQWALESDPWRSYCCVRFAWSDETAELRRSVNQVSRTTDAKQFEAPQFLEVRSGKSRMTIFTGGLPYHRRQGLRMLDALLLVQGETQCKFRLAVGFDLLHPAVTAAEFLTPDLSVANLPTPANPNAWLFQLDARSVVATQWEPVIEDGRAMGFRVHLLETEGRKLSAGLRCVRPPKKAVRLVGDGTVGPALPVEGDRIGVEIGPYEWVWLEGRW
jgi:alpha-mannosidase